MSSINSAASSSMVMRMAAYFVLFCALDFRACAVVPSHSSSKAAAANEKQVAIEPLSESVGDVSRELQTVTMHGICDITLEGVRQPLGRWGQGVFCDSFIKYINLAMSHDPCGEMILSCHVLGQRLLYNPRRELLAAGAGESAQGEMEEVGQGNVRGRFLAAKRKNKMKVKNQGRCNQRCRQESLLFEHTNRRRLASFDDDWDSLPPDVAAERKKVLYERLLIECNEMRIEFSRRPTLMFHGMKAVRIKCGSNAELVCSD